MGCGELFTLLDTGDGALTLGEFFEGIQGMEGPAKAKDSFKLLKLVEGMGRSLQELVETCPREPLNCSDSQVPSSVAKPEAHHYSSEVLQSSGRGPATKLSRQLLAVPPSVPSPQSPTESYSTGPQSSPAFNASRRKQLNVKTWFDDLTESLTDVKVAR